MAKSKDDLIADALQEIAMRHGVEFPIKGELKPEHMPAVYEALSLPLPEKARQHVNKGPGVPYAMTGYLYQYVANRLNEVVGPDHWRKVQRVVCDGFDNPQAEGRTQEVTFKVDVCLGNWQTGYEHAPPYVVFEIVAEASHYGGHSATTRADAYKGGLTDAFKKAAALLGVGKQAYEQTIDETFRPAEAEERGAAQERGGADDPSNPRYLSTQDRTPNQHQAEQPPASASSLQVLQRTFREVCKTRSLNRFSILARTYRAISTEGLTAEELVTLTKATTEGVHDTCGGTGTGDKGELVAGIGVLMMGYLADSGQPSDERAGNLAELEAAFAKAVGKDDYAKLTVAELRQQAKGVSERCQELRKTKALRRDLAKRWLVAMRVVEPSAATNDLVRALNKAAGTVCDGVGEDGYEALNVSQLEELGQKMSLGLIDVLTGEEKEET